MESPYLLIIPILQRKIDIFQSLLELFEILRIRGDRRDLLGHREKLAVVLHVAVGPGDELGLDLGKTVLGPQLGVLEAVGLVLEIVLYDGVVRAPDSRGAEAGWRLKRYSRSYFSELVWSDSGGCHPSGSCSRRISGAFCT
jgi:hypothetical protein